MKIGLCRKHCQFVRETCELQGARRQRSRKTCTTIAMSETVCKYEIAAFPELPSHPHQLATNIGCQLSMVQFARFQTNFDRYFLKGS